MEDDEKTNVGGVPLRISPFEAGFMVAVAVIIDVIQWVVTLFVFGVVTAFITGVVNTLINVCTWLLFYFWFKLKGISFVGPRQLLTMLGMGATEFASSGIFPSWSIGVWLLVSMTYAEDTAKKVTGKDISITSKLAMASGRPSGAVSGGSGVKPPALHPQKSTAGSPAHSIPDGKQSLPRRLPPEGE